MPKRAYYHSSVSDFLLTTSEEIRGLITNTHTQDIVHNQTRAWISQIKNLQEQLSSFDDGYICFELLIPRMGKRADVVFLYKGIIFVLEYKEGAEKYTSSDKRQALGYAMDLKHFHEASHERVIIPILVATNAKNVSVNIDKHESNVTEVICSNGSNLTSIIQYALSSFNEELLDYKTWLTAPYKPTPTIIEAAKALYSEHSVEDISRSDAGAINLAETSTQIQEIITNSKQKKQKSICFVTGVPGAGKTLVGLNIATTHPDGDEDDAVFLSGNGPLVTVLREALAQDEKQRNTEASIAAARQKTAKVIQNIHHFRDNYLSDKEQPAENVVIFDEAQRAWNQSETTKFMKGKRDQDSWDQSEPEFLISVMDRHDNWCVIIALIGGGQEINRGEAGLQGWLTALEKSFSHWNVYYSEALKQQEYAGNNVKLNFLQDTPKATSLSSLHLSTSMRSFRAEKLSNFIHHIIQNNPEKAFEVASQLHKNYPIYITRNVQEAKKWIRSKTRGTESSGVIASSSARRLKAQGIFVTQEIDAANWFLKEPDDVRSSNFLEDVATEFVVQGLELDWCLVGWDADFRYNNDSFEHWKFSGSRWQRRNKEEQQQYLANVYRVLLTRARQGMVIFIPDGDESDATRQPEFYDQTYNYLLSCGVKKLDL